MLRSRYVLAGAETGKKGPAYHRNQSSNHQKIYFMILIFLWSKNKFKTDEAKKVLSCL